MINMDMSKIDVNDKEQMNFLRSNLLMILTNCRKELEESIGSFRNTLHKMEERINYIESGKYTRKRTIISNLLGIIGTLLNPDLTPTELLGEKGLNDTEYQAYIEMKRTYETTQKLCRKYGIIYDLVINGLKKCEERIIQSDIFLLKFIECAIKNINTIREPNKDYGGYLYVDFHDVDASKLIDTLIECGMIDEKEREKFFGLNARDNKMHFCVELKNVSFQNAFIQLVNTFKDKNDDKSKQSRK